MLPCTLDTFFDTFLADSAKHSIQEYQESGGDVDVSVTPWKLDKDGVHSRTVEFKHHINLPMAPPFARARKEQRLYRYGRYGLSLETDTYVSDVPISSCFYVADRVLVEPTDNGKHVVVHAKFDVRFFKRMMFQSLIASQTGQKYMDGFQNQQQYWRKGLQILEEPSCTRPPTRATTVETTCEEHTTTLVAAQQQQLDTTKETRVVITPIIFTNTQCTILAFGFVSLFVVNVLLEYSYTYTT